jgi:isopentenyldiphosphate isomerase
MDYYTQELFIPQVNEQDEIIGQVERWKAHREGILHRGYTVALLYQGQMLCQHRKHPVFDGFIDLAASSHQIYQNDKLIDANTSVLQCLAREWNIELSQLSRDLSLVGKVVYNSKHGEYIEHEVCHLYLSEIKSLPVPNLEFAYGFSLLPLSQLQQPETNPALAGLAPWVTSMIKEGLLEDLR